MLKKYIYTHTLDFDGCMIKIMGLCFSKSLSELHGGLQRRKIIFDEELSTLYLLYAEACIAFSFAKIKGTDSEQVAGGAENERT